MRGHFLSFRSYRTHPFAEIFEFMWARPFGRALFAALTEPRQIPNTGSRVSSSGDDPARKPYGTPCRGQSFPRAAFGVAMLTLRRLPS
jgi:hypothetical protein